MRAGWIYLLSLCIAAGSFAYTQPIIFFHGGQDNELNPRQWEITPEAGPILERVVDEYRRYKDQYLLVIGHDENASTPELSYERSRKRAEVARQGLVNLGLPGDRLATKACSFDQPFEPGRGANPVNRRVEFVGVPSLQDLLLVDRAICPNTRPPSNQAAPRR